MADLKFSMLFEANAAAAKAEVGALQAATEQLSDATAGLGAANRNVAPDIDAAAASTVAGAGAMEGTASAGEDLAGAVQMLRMAFQPMVAEASALQDAMRTLAMLEDAGAISAREAALAHDLVSRQVIELTTRMEAAGVAIDGTTAAFARHDTALQQQINRLAGVDRGTEATVAEQLRHGQALDALRAKYNPLFAASRQYELVLNEIAEAERLGAINALEAASARDRAASALAPVPGQLAQVGAASGNAAGLVGQLTFQMNDIGMMLASGQSPFMLMVQQGPQVTQVFDEMRRRGMAIGPAIAGALGQMLNPISLVTLGVIGLGGAFVQWMTSSAETVQSLSEVIGDLEGAVSSYARALELVRTPLADLRAEWGLQTGEVRELYAAMADFERLKAFSKLGESTAKINAELSGLKDAADTISGLQARLAEAEAQQAAGLIGPERALELRETISIFAEGLEQEFGLTIAQAQALSAALDDLTAAEGPAQVAAATSTLRDLLMDVAAEGGKLSTALLPVGDAILTAEMSARNLAGPLADGAAASDGLMASVLGARDALVSMVASAPGGGWLSGAIGAAANLAGQLWNAQAAAAATRNAQAALNAMKIEFSPGGQALTRYGSRTPGGSAEQNALAERNAPVKSTSGAGAISGTGAGKGGGGGGATAEKDAVQELIKAQERQIETLRITDPVQREIEKNHEALAKASDEERQKLEELIRERMRLEDIRDRVAEIGKTGERAFVGLVTGAHSFSDALGMMLDKLAEMAASSAWDLLWEGNTGSGGGWGGLGGLLGDWLGLADGGLVAGPGGPRDDRVPVRASAGEYVVNAAATARHLPLVEAINAGASIDSMLRIIGGRDGALATPPGAAPGNPVTSRLPRERSAAASVGLSGLSGRAGMIGGAGGSRDDRIEIRASAGEYIVNAAATARHLPLVEAINAGASIDSMLRIVGGTAALPAATSAPDRVPGPAARQTGVAGSRPPAFADGGRVGMMPGAVAPAAYREASQTGSASAPAAGGAGEVAVRIYFDARKSDWTAEVKRISGTVAAEVVEEGIGIFSDQMLPDRMAEIDASPRVRG